MACFTTSNTLLVVVPEHVRLVPCESDVRAVSADVILVVSHGSDPTGPDLRLASSVMLTNAPLSS